jgi:hypothetical protein
MGAAAAPMLIGSAIGGLTNRKNPLQGALLGGVLGGAGGAFMSGAGGLSSLLPSLGGAAAPTAAGSLTGAVIPATGGGFAGGGFGSIGAAPAFNPAAIFANPTAAIGTSAIGGGPTTGMIPSSMAPSLMENIGSGLEGVGKYATQNQTLTNQALQSAQQMMQQPEPQFAPVGQVKSGQIQGGDYMSLLNPQQGTVLRPQPISLLG